MPRQRSSGLSRRGALTRALAAMAGASLALAGRAAALGSIPQDTAGYQDKPKGDLKCSNCTHFRAPNACQLVAGTISPDGWCKLFAAKGE